MRAWPAAADDRLVPANEALQASLDQRFLADLGTTSAHGLVFAQLSGPAVRFRTLCRSLSQLPPRRKP